MTRSEVILNKNQKELLDTLAFIESRRQSKRITRSALIRECINYWWNHKEKRKLSDSELILINPALLEDIAAAREDLKAGREYTHKEMLRELKK